MAHAELLRNPRRHAVQPQRGFSRRQVGYLEILPGYPVSPAGADGFHARFLGRKPRRKALEAVRFALHVSDLRRRVDALDEAPAIALDQVAHARYLCQIHSRADDHLISAPEVVRVSRPCLTPFVLINASASERTPPARPRITITSRHRS